MVADVLSRLAVVEEKLGSLSIDYVGLHEWKNDYAMPALAEHGRQVAVIEGRLSAHERAIHRLGAVVVGPDPAENSGIRTDVLVLTRKLDQHISENAEQSREFSRQLSELNERFHRTGKWAGRIAAALIAIYTPEQIGRLVKMITEGIK